MQDVRIAAQSRSLDLEDGSAWLPACREVRHYRHYDGQYDRALPDGLSYLP
jgi:hypothetical protein